MCAVTLLWPITQNLYWRNFKKAYGDLFLNAFARLH